MAGGGGESIRYYIAEYGVMSAEEKNWYWGRKVMAWMGDGR